MDWCVDATDATALRALRRELTSYLRRHAAPGSDVDGAEIALGELLANAVRHAPGPIWVRVDWSARRPVVEVHDLGPGFDLTTTGPPGDPFSVSGRGLHMVGHLTERLEVAAKGAGGTKVTMTVAVERRMERDHDPPRSLTAALPMPEEARDDGTFGKESFLRALVVEMARAVEAGEGPDAAEAAVAQVGANIGGRMEEEYRRARGLVGRLTPQQIADLYVRLKAAIDGDFHVVEANDERIVLANTACPFGDVVKRAPGLCRMTSSVFGGIAARNAGHASVVLEERIAVGDPHCRVVVHLVAPRGEDSGVGHSYLAPSA